MIAALTGLPRRYVARGSLFLPSASGRSGALLFVGVPGRLWRKVPRQYFVDAVYGMAGDAHDDISQISGRVEFVEHFPA